MNHRGLGVAWYRFRSTLRHRKSEYAALALLIGALGGVAMGAMSASRRTQSSYPAFLASTHPSDLTMSVYGSSSADAATSYSPTLTRDIGALPHVRRVEEWVGIGAAPLQPDGAPDLNPALLAVGSVDGLYFDIDRVTPVRGRVANPERPDEFVTTAIGARLLGAHVGQVVPIGIYSVDQFGMPGFGTASVAPARRIDMTLVGIVAFNNEVVEDAVDRVPTNVVYTPALTRTLLSSAQGTWYGLQLEHGARDVAAVERELIELMPSGATYNFRVTSLAEAKVERAVRPEAIALAALGAIATLAGLVIASLAISRQLHNRDDELVILRALGENPAALVLDNVIGVVGAVVVGAALACLTAVALSPLAPLGPVRPVYPSRGLALDWTVLGAGMVVLIGGLGLSAAILAYRAAPHRLRRSSSSVRWQTSASARAASATGLPLSGMLGVRFAVDPGQGRTAVPVRSALTGGVLAVVMVVATLTFGSGLRTLVSRPDLYGWNWNYALVSVNDVPPQARDALDHDPNVAAWAGYIDLNAQIDGENVPILLGDLTAAVSPPILSGHGVQAADQIVLGATTLARLHKRIGDTVTVTYGTAKDAPLFVPPTRLSIVGKATLPAVAGQSTLADHTSMGTGAVVPVAIAGALAQAAASPDPTLNGPPLVFVRMRHGVSAAAGLADMKRIAGIADRAFAADQDAVGDTLAVQAVQRPAEIVNYRSTGGTPFALAAGLAAGATVAIGITLGASVRRRRRDLALLKTLGFTRRQLAATVAWQASVVAAVAVALGVPIGIAAGRWLWILFAHQISVVAKPTVPVASVALVGVAAVVLANAIAAVPGRVAARTPAASILRSP